MQGKLINLPEIEHRGLHAIKIQCSGSLILNNFCSTLSAGDMCPGEFACGSSGRDSCRDTVEKYRAAITTVTDDEGEELAGNAACCRNESDAAPEDEAQTTKHIVLLLFLLCSMFVVC